MPITPFHFGPATMVKAAAPKHFSILTFALTQIVIDLETLSYIALGAWLYFLAGFLPVDNPVMEPWTQSIPTSLVGDLSKDDFLCDADWRTIWRFAHLHHSQMKTIFM